LPNVQNGPPKDAVPETGLGGNTQPPLPLVRDGKVIDRLKQDGLQGIVKRYTEDAMRFIREQKEHRFFLYLPHTAVHFPLYPGKEFHGKSTNGVFGDWVEEVDWSVGQVLDLVRELKLDANTLVLFTSDNGGTPRSVNAPLRGFKASTWEGGMRVPTIAWWPGKVPANTSTDEITSMMDILPTFASMSGGKLPDRKIDGGNIWPILSGQPGAKSPHSDLFYFYRGLKLEAVRSGPWKLQIASPDGGGAGKGKKGKAAPAEAFPRLFNLETDIGETKNVAADHADIVARLQALVEKAKDDLGIDGKGPGVRELGRVDHPEPFIRHDGSIRADAQP
jgi:arylsulfatase A